MNGFSPTIPVGLLWTLARWAMPPRVEFGSPVQRQKKESTCHYHVPIKLCPRFKIGPGTMPNCRIFLDRYSGDIVSESIRLCWGDACFSEISERENLYKDEMFLVPIAWREEEKNDGNAYITDTRYFKNEGEKVHALTPDRSKHRFKLRVKSGKYERASPHFYLLRVPVGVSNGHFTVEIEYEGEGTRGMSTT
jgi:hypothetical protein